MRFWFSFLFIYNSGRAKTKQFHLKGEGSHTALTQNNSRPKLNRPKYFGYYFFVPQPCIFQTTSTETVGFHTWWGILGPRVLEDEITGLCLKEKQNSSSWKHLDTTWTWLCSVTPSDRRRVNCHQPKYGNFHPNTRNLFLLRRWVTPGAACPKGLEMLQTSVLGSSSGCAGRGFDSVTSSSLCSSPFAKAGMLLHEIIPQFPDFHQPHLPLALQAQCLLKVVFSRAGTTPNPHPWPFAETATNI